MQYTYFFWSLILLLIWLVVFVVQRPQRKKMLMMSVGTAPLGLSEPLFYPSYWFPPTVLDLGGKTGFDLESIIFSFAIGGLASSLYGLFGNNKLLPVGECERHSRHHRFHKFLLSSPVWLFLGLEWLTSWNAIYTASWSLLWFS